MPVRNIAVIAGSLREDSISRKIANALIDLAPRDLSLELVEIGDLPLYNEDLEKPGPPDTWAAFRKRLGAAEGVIFVTPEYNRSMSGAIKNAIDVGSRPYGASVFSGKPAAVISQSPGALGGFGANHDLRRGLVFLDMPVLQQPEAYLSRSGEFFDDDGRLVKDGVRKLLEKILAAYAEHVERYVQPARRDAAA